MVTAASKPGSLRRSEAEERAGLEFLVITENKTLFETVALAIRKVRGRLNCTPSPAAAKNYLSHRRVDGILVDMDLAGALEIVATVRGSRANRSSVVFAFLNDLPAPQLVVKAGANFVLHQPILLDNVSQVFSAALPLMVSGKRKDFRYPLMVPVELKMNERRVESTMSNLSEGGMAIWSLFYYPPGATIDFAFELPFGGRVLGRGEVAWANGDGLAGIRFQQLSDQATAHLSDWIRRRHFASAS